MTLKFIRQRPAVILGIVFGGILLSVSFLALVTGVFSIERHRGFFAPVWNEDGQRVYLIQREAYGVVWGLGWEFFSPPASSYVISDTISLRRIDAAGGSMEMLERFDGSPVEGRVTKHYRGRIFNSISARVTPIGDSAEFTVRMNIPRVPRSEPWSLTGHWSPDRPSGARWVSNRTGSMGTPDDVLKNGVELMAIRGRESFPAAIIAVNADGSYRVLVKNDDYDTLYPDGIPGRKVAERARRPHIERGRELRRVKDELVARYRQQGLNDGAARLRAHDDMEEMGYFPKTPRLVAMAVTEAPAGVRVFDIPGDYFKVGLFTDIAKAIAEPGTEVKTHTGTYLKYYDDDVGVRLRAWRAAGNDRFAVRTDGTLYVMNVRRFK